MTNRLFYLSFFALICLVALPLCSYGEQDFPVLYKGRFRPAETYARLWLYENYHSPSLKKADLPAFQTKSTSAIHLLWSLEINGHVPYQSAPLFRIGSAELKNLLNLPLKQERFNFKEISSNSLHSHFLNAIKQNGKLASEWAGLTANLREFESLNENPSLAEQAFQKRYTVLKNQKIAPKEIAVILEQEYPIADRVKKAGPLFKSLPGRFQGNWFSLQALMLEVYDPQGDKMKPVENFTLYSDDDFSAIRKAYLELVQEKKTSSFVEKANQLSNLLLHAYRPLEGQYYQQAYGKSLHYPSISQLKAETFYISYPLIPVLIFLYGFGSFLLISSLRLSSPFWKCWGTRLVIFAFFFHTLLLAMRCYIVGRPPVTNMFETVIYVPWVATWATILFPLFRRNTYVLLAASLTSIILLVILEVTNLNQSLEQVQAVLDSQFWLLIHVLLVVGSYGIFFLGALLGHFYLGLYLFHKKETSDMKTIGELILQTMYGGTILLVSGTILGGIWAAESWGRFWDWDPKESWAFISSCFYLMWIHAYRFNYISSFGLAIGAVSGLLAISFTWYGVNYILGTGLHSYGFGSGGEIYYYIFLSAESFFLILMVWSHIKYNKLDRLNIKHIDIP